IADGVRHQVLQELGQQRRIAQMHGGSIWCEAENGPGATFILEVPLAEARPVPSAASAVPHSTRTAEQQAEGSGRLAEV
ncbi:hypothetical protein AB9E34_34000, partial [Rhizobium leguminosarum]